MSQRNIHKLLCSLSQALISLLMVLGFLVDGAQDSDPLFLIATLLWVYQPTVVRTESRLWRSLGARYLPRSTKV